MFLSQAEGRGVKDPERLKRQQKRREDAEKEALKQGPSEGGLKVITYLKDIKLYSYLNMHSYGNNPCTMFKFRCTKQLLQGCLVQERRLYALFILKPKLPKGLYFGIATEYHVHVRNMVLYLVSETKG